MTSRTSWLGWLLLAVVLAAVTSVAGARSVISDPPANGNTKPPPQARTESYTPHTNWLVLCSGCHLPKAHGVPDLGVPRINGFVGNFLKVDGGREYLVRVPGAAQAPLTDAQLADLLNWLVQGPLAGDSAPTKFQPYTAAEVGDLRDDSFLLPDARRAELLQLMKNQGIVSVSQ